MERKIFRTAIQWPVFFLGLCTLGASALAQPPGDIFIRLDRVDGLVAPDTIRAGDTVRFHIMYGTRDTCSYSVSNAFKLYSRATLTSGGVGSGTARWVTTPPANRWYGVQFSSGASTGVQVDTTGFIEKATCLGLYSWECFGCDGIGADTVEFSGARGGNLEFPLQGPDSGIAFVIWVVTNVADSGKIICIDSSTFYPPSGSWKWPPWCGMADWAFPTWSGERCFVLAAKPCCIGLSGNVDCSVDQNIDIGDITALIDHLYLSQTSLCCTEQANVDGEAGVDIGDLSRLIDYLYISFTPPAWCL